MVECDRVLLGNVDNFRTKFGSVRKARPLTKPLTEALTKPLTKF